MAICLVSSEVTPFSFSTRLGTDPTGRREDVAPVQSRAHQTGLHRWRPGLSAEPQRSVRPDEVVVATVVRAEGPPPQEVARRRRHADDVLLSQRNHLAGLVQFGHKGETRRTGRPLPRPTEPPPCWHRTPSTPLGLGRRRGRSRGPDRRGGDRRAIQRCDRGFRYLPDLVASLGIEGRDDPAQAQGVELTVGKRGRRLRSRTMQLGCGLEREWRWIAGVPQLVSGVGIERPHHLVFTLTRKHVQPIADQHGRGVAVADVDAPPTCQVFRPRRWCRKGGKGAVPVGPAPLRPVRAGQQRCFVRRLWRCVEGRCTTRIAGKGSCAPEFS